jgi:hypothetical protein
VGGIIVKLHPWHLSLLFMLLVVSPFPQAVLAQEEEPSTGTAEESGAWAEIRRLYEEAKKTGERVPKDIFEWVRQDLQRAGDWEYRVVDVDFSEPEGIEKTLNEMGEERWECFWVGVAGGKSRFMLKRRARTYLQKVALTDLLKMLPTGIDPGD